MISIIDEYDYDSQDEAILYNISCVGYDAVFFSCYMWNISRSLEIARKIKLLMSNVLIVFGGPEVDDAEKILKENQYVDFVSIGEGELLTRNLLLNKLIGMEEYELMGVAYRKGDNIFKTRPTDLLENLDVIPSIVYEDKVRESHMVLYETSRGCPFQCKYCCWANKEMRYYSLKRVEDDLKVIFTYSNIEQIFIIDSELDINIERAKEIMRIIKRYNKRNITVQGFLGLHKIDEELLDLCKLANFKFGIGIQTVSDKGLEDAGRTWFKPREFEKKVPVIKKYYDIKDIEFQLIMGLPGDDYVKFRNNLKWCEKMGAEHITANRLYIMPGSYFYDHKDKYQIVADEQPYHLIYSNYTYSYNDLINSEVLLHAYQIVRMYFGGIQKIICENKQVKVWDLIDSLAVIFMEEKIYSQGRQESQTIIKEHDYNLYLKRALKNLNKDVETINRYVDYVITKRNANDDFRKLIYTTEKMGSEQKIHSYYIGPYVKRSASGGTLFIEFTRNNVFFLFDYKHKLLKNLVVTLEKEKIFTEVLNKLLFGIKKEEINKCFVGDSLVIYNYLLNNNMIELNNTTN